MRNEPLSSCFPGCESIHLEAVLVPQYRYRGSNASLLCKYELQANEELFSLKWYKEDTEFYRHTPPDPLSQPPPMTGYGNPPSFNLNYPTNPISSGLVQTWPVPGIKIDVSIVFHQTYKGMAMSLVKGLETLLFNCCCFFPRDKEDWLKTEIERLKLLELIASLDIINSIPCRVKNALDFIF